MKCIVITPFIDKDTEIFYAVGDTFESSDSERVSFLQEQGYLRKTVKDTVKQVVKRTRKKASESDVKQS